MYRQVDCNATPAEKFKLPFDGKLSEDNRWVILAKLIPWSEFEQKYAQQFSENIGAPAKSFRMALGALIIKEKLGTSDRETVEQIRENPYLQYFIGLEDYTNQAPFDPSMFVHFRERIGVELITRINKQVVKEVLLEDSSQSEKKKDAEEISEPKNKGKLIVDSTVAPSDISYPTDLNLLNQVRIVMEVIIDYLYKQLKSQLYSKPKTYRKIARKNYLSVAKSRKPSRKKIKQAIKKQLQYIKRNLANIDKLIEANASLELLSKRQYKLLLVATEVYRQQLWMYENNKNRIEDRIVNLTQPHVRPIVRGKARNSTEFGAKLSVSCIEGYVFLDRISWNNYNESRDLKTQIENFKNFTGYYPESVHVDKIYRTRENRAWCKERGIRISGPPLGRPPKNVTKETKKIAHEDEIIRNSIEGKFGQAKRRYSLAPLAARGAERRPRIMSKLPLTSETSIAITFLVMNLSAILRQILCLFYTYFEKLNIFPPSEHLGLCFSYLNII